MLVLASGVGWGGRLTHTSVNGWLRSDPQKMNGSFRKAQQVQKPPFYLRSSQSEAAERRLQCLGRSQSTSKTDNGLACYLELFSIRKQSNYGSLSQGSHAGPHEARGTLRMFEPAPRNLQRRPAKHSSWPWLGIGIRSTVKNLRRSWMNVGVLRSCTLPH